MKSCEEMTQDVLRRVREYDEEKQARRTKIRKAAAVTAPVCAAAVVGTGLWYSGAFSQANKPSAADQGSNLISESTVSQSRKAVYSSTDSAAETTVTNTAEQHREDTTSKNETASGEMTESKTTVAEASVQTTAAAETTVAANTSAVRTTAPSVTAAGTQSASGGNGPMLREGDEPPEYLTLIQSYPSGGGNDYAVPKDGEVILASSVRAAMNEYGDSAQYRVRITLWSGSGTKNITDYSSLLAESERLGCISGVETYYNGSSSSSFLWIQATYSELSDFCGRADYGYFITFPSNDQSSTQSSYNSGVFF